MDLKAMMEKAKATDCNVQRTAQPLQPQRITDTKEFSVGIAESLFSIWEAVQLGSGTHNLRDVEVEARLGMILSQQPPCVSRWKHQMSSKLVTAVTDSHRRVHNLKFDAGADGVLVNYLRNSLNSANFTMVAKVSPISNSVIVQ